MAENIISGYNMFYYDDKVIYKWGAGILNEVEHSMIQNHSNPNFNKQKFCTFLLLCIDYES